MDTLNCPNQYKMPGGREFDELFDAWTLDTTIVAFVRLYENYIAIGGVSHTLSTGEGFWGMF